MSHPLVSIIIPCYNAERYVAEAIQSALDQTHPNCEVIVIDDGSSDGSLKVIKSFGDRIQWTTGPNRGGCAARNQGILASRGEWTQFLDADDILQSRCVEVKLAKAIQDRFSPIIWLSNVGFLNCNSIELDKKRLADSGHYWLSGNYSLEYMILSGSPQTAAPLHRKQDLEAIGGFDEDLPCAQEFALHLALSAKLGVVFRVVEDSEQSNVLIRPLLNSVSTREGANVHRNIGLVLERYILPAAMENGPWGSYLARILAMRYTDLYHAMMRRGDRREAARCMSLIRDLGMKPNAFWLRGHYGTVATTLGHRLGAHLVYLIKFLLRRFK